MIICLYIAFSSTNDFLLSISKRFSLWEYTFFANSPAIVAVVRVLSVKCQFFKENNRASR